MTLLSVSDLRVTFETDRGRLVALDGLDLEIGRGEAVCLVGESGSGKTVACEAITRLVATPPGEVTGEVRFDGFDVLSADEEAVRSLRGDRIAHVFQHPQNALDPVYTIGEQVAETVRINTDCTADRARERAVSLLDRVGIPDPATRYDEHPHEFSGGMQQRVVIAAALAAQPDLLVADEPTTAVDVTTQAQLLSLLADLQREREMGLLYVTHDLGVVSAIADRVVVLYAGTVMERGDADDVLGDPAHPYTRALLASYPQPGRSPRPIDGDLPDPTDPPAGCRFHPRCPHAVAECRSGDHPTERPASAPGHRVACVYYEDGRDPTTIGDGDPLAGDGGSDRG